jgi:ATP phosphoribosyltransferase
MTLRIAFAKGRGAAEGIRLLELDGIALPHAFYEGRLAVHHVPHLDLLCVLARGRDIAQLLEQGHIDAAIGSGLLFEEYDSPEIFQAAAMNIAPCRLSLITLDDGSKKDLTTIGTRYPHLTRKLLRNICPSPSLIELSGCVESALFLGLTEAITDIVETGWTLEALSLRECEILTRFSHGIWLRCHDSHSCMDKLRVLMPSVTWEAELKQVVEIVRQ